MTTDLSNLSIAELKKIKRNNQQKLKKEYLEYKKKLIDDIRKTQKVRDKINSKTKPKPKPKPKIYLNLNPNLNPLKSKHLKSIFKIV